MWPEGWVRGPGDLAGDPDIAQDEVGLEELAEVGDGLGDGEDPHLLEQYIGLPMAR